MIRRGLGVDKEEVVKLYTVNFGIYGPHGMTPHPPQSLFTVDSPEFQTQTSCNFQVI